MSELVSLRAIVHGRVQGVFFRDFTRQHAVRLGVKGYVRNVPGGRVEVVAEGEKQNLEILVGYLKVGPPSAVVEKVDVVWSAYTGGYSEFITRY